MEEISFHYLLMASHLTFQKNMLALLKDTGLTPGQPKILDYLAAHDGAGQKEIAMACHMEAASLTTVLNGMENRGLIERRTRNGNRRSSYVFLTQKGKELQKIVLENFCRLESCAFQGISENEQQNLRKTLFKIYENMIRTQEALQNE